MLITKFSTFAENDPQEVGSGSEDKTSSKFRQAVSEIASSLWNILSALHVSHSTSNGIQNFRIFLPKMFLIISNFWLVWTLLKVNKSIKLLKDCSVNDSSSL